MPEGVSSELAAAALLQGMTAHYLATDTYHVQRVIAHDLSRGAMPDRSASGKSSDAERSGVIRFEIVNKLDSKQASTIDEVIERLDQIIQWAAEEGRRIGYFAAPPIASKEIDAWAKGMAPFARLEHVSCKLSGLITEADWERWKPDEVIPYVERVVEWFGEDRLLFGSDWPVCMLAGSYDDVVEILEHALGEILTTVREKIFGRNAVAFYQLPDVSP